MLRFAIQWTVFMLFWLLFVFQFSVSEILIGTAASALAVAAASKALSCVPLCFEPEPRWLADGLRVPSIVLKDLIILIKELFRRASGASSRSLWSQCRFQSGAGCRGSAQRALSVLYLTSSPNTVVAHIDPASGAMVMHELVPAPVPGLIQRLQE